MKSVSTRLSQSDLVSLLLVSPWLHRTLISYPSLWLVIDLREMNNVGDQLIAALSLLRYQHVKQINLEMAKGGCSVIFVKKPMSKPRTNRSTIDAHLVELLVICCVQNTKSPNVSPSQTVAMVKSWPSEHTLLVYSSKTAEKPFNWHASIVLEEICFKFSSDLPSLLQPPSWQHLKLVPSSHGFTANETRRHCSCSPWSYCRMPLSSIVAAGFILLPLYIFTNLALTQKPCAPCMS